MKAFYTAIVLSGLASAAFGQTPNEPAAGNGFRHIVQAFAGFNQPNDLGIPCAGPCLAFPVGVVVVEPNQFVSSNSAGLYYAVLQTDGWTGDLSTTFALTEGGAVVQTLTVPGSITAQQASPVTVLSTSATIPQSSYAGPALLTATTTATPSNGATPFTLQSYSTPLGIVLRGIPSRRLEGGSRFEF